MADENNTGDTTVTTTEEPAWAKNLQESMGKMGQGIDALVTLAQRSASQPAPAPAAEEEEEVDTGEDLLEDQSLEMLPRKAFAEKIFDSLGSRMETMLKPLAERIDQLGVNNDANNYKMDALHFAERTPDFGEWEQEMMKIAEELPTASIARIYKVARAENPAKAAEIDKKYGLNGQTKEGEPPKPAARPAAKPRAPLSISPASGSGDVRNQRMNQEEAAQDAWDKAVAAYGNPFSGES